VVSAQTLPEPGRRDKTKVCHRSSESVSGGHADPAAAAQQAQENVCRRLAAYAAASFGWNGNYFCQNWTPGQLQNRQGTRPSGESARALPR